MATSRAERSRFRRFACTNGVDHLSEQIGCPYEAGGGGQKGKVRWIRPAAQRLSTHSRCSPIRIVARTGRHSLVVSSSAVSSKPLDISACDAWGCGTAAGNDLFPAPKQQIAISLYLPPSRGITMQSFQWERGQSGMKSQ